MRPIGWTLAWCAVLAAAFPKSAISTDVGSALVAGGRSGNATGRAEVTKLLPISKDEAADPDIRRLREFLDDFFVGGSNDHGINGGEARTFGHKRIQLMLMPLMYKMGVMMTMLTVLTVISIKGVLIGAVLLMLKLSTIIAKFYTGWHAQAPSAQPIHVHVHNGLPGAHNQAYNAWMPHSGPEDNAEHYYYRG